MISDNKPYVIEYNVRFGDPECQTLLMNLKSEIDLIVQIKSIIFVLMMDSNQSP